SCGATLFSLLTGKRVHEAETTGEQIVYAATLKARSLAEVWPEGPKEIVAIVDKALAFDKQARWSTAAEMQDALADAHTALYGSSVASGIAAITARDAQDATPTLDGPSLANARAMAPSPSSGKTPSGEAAPGRAEGVKGRRGVVRAAIAGLFVAA